MDHLPAAAPARSPADGAHHQQHRTPRAKLWRYLDAYCDLTSDERFFRPLQTENTLFVPSAAALRNTTAPWQRFPVPPVSARVGAPQAAVVFDQSCCVDVSPPRDKESSVPTPPPPPQKMYRREPYRCATVVYCDPAPQDASWIKVPWWYGMSPSAETAAAQPHAPPTPGYVPPPPYSATAPQRAHATIYPDSSDAPPAAAVAATLSPTGPRQSENATTASKRSALAPSPPRQTSANLPVPRSRMAAPTDTMRVVSARPSHVAAGGPAGGTSTSFVQAETHSTPLELQCTTLQEVVALPATPNETESRPHAELMVHDASPTHAQQTPTQPVALPQFALAELSDVGQTDPSTSVTDKQMLTGESNGTSPTHQWPSFEPRSATHTPPPESVMAKATHQDDATVNVAVEASPDATLNEEDVVSSGACEAVSAPTTPTDAPKGKSQKPVKPKSKPTPVQSTQPTAKAGGARRQAKAKQSVKQPPTTSTPEVKPQPSHREKKSHNAALRDAEEEALLQSAEVRAAAALEGVERHRAQQEVAAQERHAVQAEEALVRQYSLLRLRIERAKALGDVVDGCLDLLRVQLPADPPAERMIHAKEALCTAVTTGCIIGGLGWIGAATRCEGDRLPKQLARQAVVLRSVCKEVIFRVGVHWSTMSVAAAAAFCAADLTTRLVRDRAETTNRSDAEPACWDSVDPRLPPIAPGVHSGQHFFDYLPAFAAQLWCVVIEGLTLSELQAFLAQQSGVFSAATAIDPNGVKYIALTLMLATAEVLPPGCEKKQWISEERAFHSAILDHDWPDLHSHVCRALGLIKTWNELYSSTIHAGASQRFPPVPPNPSHPPLRREDEPSSPSMPNIPRCVPTLPSPSIRDQNPHNTTLHDTLHDTTRKLSDLS